MNFDQFISEIERFADIDSPLQSSSSEEYWIARFRQQGFDVELKFICANGSVIEKRDGIERIIGSYRGLLASPHFGNLALLTRLQKAQGAADLNLGSNPEHLDIPIIAEFEHNHSTANSASLLKTVDDWAIQPSTTAGVKVLIIDGPAGIGKTHLIRSLVYNRALAYGPNSLAPVLHVQSRGRQLTTLPDLLAGTLQSLRIFLTYEQVPILIRHGLLQVAIDGFDELADPNGYDTAWHSLNEFISDISGDGVLLLAGRDTFIAAETVANALPILARENINAMHLRPPLSTEAVGWLRRQDIEEAKLKFLQSSGILAEGAYSLRPFFLKQIKSILEASSEVDFYASFPLQTLVDAMIRREAPIAAKLTPNLSTNEIENLLQNLLREVARDMADYESEAIDVPSLQLISEIVFSSAVKEEPMRALRNRVKSIALLDTDIAPEKRRFVHTEVQSYFLAQAYIDLFSGDSLDIPRSVRRNILSSDFLETFHNVTMSTSPIIVGKFQSRAQQEIISRRYDDRSVANISSMLLASADAELNGTKQIVIEDVSIDECILRGNVGPAKISRSSISQLDIRGADISDVEFSSTILTCLYLDSASELPMSLPQPQILLADSKGKQVRIFNPADIQELIEVFREEQASAARPMLSGSLGKLLDKLCRVCIRQTWIRQAEGDRAGKLLSDPDWARLHEILNQYGLVEERNNKQARGSNSKFIRIRNPDQILDHKSTSPNIIEFRDALLKASQN